MEPSTDQTKTDVSIDVTKTDTSANNPTKTDTDNSRTNKYRKSNKLNEVQYFRKLRTLTGFENHDVTKERRPQWSFGVKSDGYNQIDNKMYVFPKGSRRSTTRTRNPKNICLNEAPKCSLFRCYSANYFK